MPSKITAIAVPGLLALTLLFGGWGVAKLVSRARAPASSPTPSVSPPSFSAAGSLAPAALAPLSLPPVRLDTDADGLPDDLETLWHTDVQNPDTDGDGYQDGLEVTNGYDPTKPSPGDRRSPASGTGLTRSPSPTKAPTTPTFTEQFLSQTGLAGDPRSLLKSDELQRFVTEANARAALPEISDRRLNVVSTTGKAAAERYLDAISVPQNKNISPVTIEQLTAAFTAFTQEKNDQSLQDIVAKLRRNVSELAKAPVPKEALALHRQYVAASTALLESAEALLRYQTDFVGALVAASRIENLRSTFTAVSDGIKELEKKYVIT